MTYAPEEPSPARLSVSGLLVAATLVGVVAAVVSLVDRPSLEQHELQLLGVFLGFICVGQFFRFTLPGNRDTAPVGAAMALAMAMVPQIGSTPVTYTPAVVVVVTLIGTVVGVLPHAVGGRAPTLDVVAREVLVVGVAAVLFRTAAWPGLGVPAEALAGPVERGWLLAVPMVVVATLVGTLNLVLASVIRASRVHTPLHTALRDEAGAGLGVFAAVAITGVLIALAARPMDLLAVPVFAVPLLVTQFAFRRYAAVRMTYRQTLGSLARLPELGGYTQTLHSERVTVLSVAVGRRLGLRESELLELEYAAQLHDIGQLSLSEPVAGGATSLLSAPEQRRLAVHGAEVVRQAGVLGAAARIVEHQAHPYRRVGVDGPDGDGSVPLASRILKVCNAFDDLVGESADRSLRARALEQLRLGVASDFDPRVVHTLAAVSARA